MVAFLTLLPTASAGSSGLLLLPDTRRLMEVDLALSSPVDLPWHGRPSSALVRNCLLSGRLPQLCPCETNHPTI